jgi:homoserine dehydrogenase
MQAIHIGLAGVGTVGRGVVELLKRNQAEIRRRVGRDIVLTYAAGRDFHKTQAAFADQTQVRVIESAMDLANLPDIDIVVELIGGDTYAKDLILAAIHNGKHVVTANKKLLALHGDEIFALAQQKGVMVAFEAAVAGGIPIIKALREGLAANRIEWIAGIINGTSNFILSKMRETGAAFPEVLAEAQALGYAEADPTFDIEGHDAGHKLTIMAAIAFGMPMQFDHCHLEGISGLSATDMAYAEEFGYRVKLLGYAKRNENGVALRVAPTLIPEQRLIANVNGVMNAVLVQGDALGASLYYGPGAGSMPTASAVVADLIDVARVATADPENRVPHLAFQPDQMATLPMLTLGEMTCAYYLRITSVDKVGVLAEVTAALAAHQVSVEALIQKEAPNGHAEIVIITHATQEKNVDLAVAYIQNLPSSTLPIVRLRVEALAA